MSRGSKLAIAGALLLVAALPAAFVAFRPVTVIPRLSLAPGFGLVDQDGGRLTSDDLKGSLTLYGFTYGACEGACNHIVETMAEVQLRLPDAGLGELPVRLVTVSFDPERDTPGRLRELAARSGAIPGTWDFVTARDTTEARAIVGTGFGAWYEKRPDGSFAFDPVLVLVDGLGVRRVEYRVGEPDADRILSQMSELGVEARAEGVMRFAYEAAHFLSCYSN